MTDSAQALTIALAVGIPAAFVVAVAAFLICRSQRRKARLFRRGITPIGDEEIESWKVDSDAEKTSIDRNRPSHHTTRSTSSIQKPASVIVYTPGQYTRRLSEQSSPKSPKYKRSLEIAPLSQARAPNARPGLTDESVQGEAAYLTHKRQTSRLSKYPSPTTGQRSRAWSTRSMTRPDVHEQWYGDELPPRRSTETFTRARSMHTTTSKARSSISYSRMSLDNEPLPGGLSPRPQVHQSEIGRAIG